MICHISFVENQNKKQPSLVEDTTSVEHVAPDLNQVHHSTQQPHQSMTPLSISVKKSETESKPERDRVTTTERERER